MNSKFQQNNSCRFLESQCVCTCPRVGSSLVWKGHDIGIDQCRWGLFSIPALGKKPFRHRHVYASLLKDAQETHSPSFNTGEIWVLLDDPCLDNDKTWSLGHNQCSFPVYPATLSPCLWSQYGVLALYAHCTTWRCNSRDGFGTNCGKHIEKYSLRRHLSQLVQSIH